MHQETLICIFQHTFEFNSIHFNIWSSTIKGIFPWHTISKNVVAIFKFNEPYLDNIHKLEQCHKKPSDMYQKRKTFHLGLGQTMFRKVRSLGFDKKLKP